MVNTRKMAVKRRWNILAALGGMGLDEAIKCSSDALDQQ
jgi:hypothetical protein|tara:strand:+ start:58 stop:174 length:117 start_codon:yes stop_codon:yes gene_type:complete